jgi:hypothetical protein
MTPMFDELDALATEDIKEKQHGVGGGLVVKTKEYYEKEIAKGKAFVKIVKAKAIETDEGKAACFPAEKLRAALGNEVPQRGEGVDNLAQSVAASVRSLFARAGMIPKTRGAVSVRGDQVCIFPGEYKAAVGSNDFEKYVSAAALKRGLSKMHDLDTLRSVGVPISDDFNATIEKFVEENRLAAPRAAKTE